MPPLFFARIIRPFLLTLICGSVLPAKAADFALRGRLLGAAPGTRIVLTDPATTPARRLDSIATDAQGRFVMRGNLAGPVVYAVVLGKAAEPVLVALEPGANIHLEATAEQPQSTVRLSGTPAAAVLQTYQSILQQHRRRTQELIRQGEQRPEPWNEAWSERTKGTMQLIRQQPQSYVAAYALVDLSGFVRDEVLLDSLTQLVTTSGPVSRYTQVLLERQRVRRATAPGQLAPELALRAPDGRVIPLTSLRGKYVLVDFWASWCKPCRAENPALVRLYQQYQPKGFEVYAVSLDDSRDKWLKAIAADQLPWVQVSDLLGFQSPSAAAYDARAIPLTLLLDPQGRIVAKDLRGKALEERLAKLFP